MKLDAIKEAIKKWDTSRNDLDGMKALFKGVNCFTFTWPDDFSSDDAFIHAYLAVSKTDTLDMLLIPRSKDREKQEYIQEHVVKVALGYEEILKDVVDPKDAKRRIGNWENHCESWLKTRLDEKEIIHQVFVIPKRYLKRGRTYLAFFALKDEVGTPGNVTSLVGDMIVWDKDTNAIVYPNNDDTGDTFYNTIYLVPPFKPILKEIATKEKFYLLKLANAIYD
ncbi:hypothetical protein [Dokdonia sp.]|uniref:hypothetical protein n=1 Tax=Dokdonia sp. TaxID=2024995 RepID=UPI00326321C8